MFICFVGLKSCCIQRSCCIRADYLKMFLLFEALLFFFYYSIYLLVLKVDTKAMKETDTQYMCPCLPTKSNAICKMSVGEKREKKKH